MIECVMAGRIMPAFTMSATPGLRLKVRTWLDTATLWVATPPGPLSASAFGLAAGAASPATGGMAALGHA